VEPLTPERRREQTREHLLAAAAEVFAREGFYGASLDEVAAAAGFTKGAVYSNFKNKEDLFVAVLEARATSQIAGVEALVDDATSPDEKLPAILEMLSSTEYDSEWAMLNLEFVLYAARNPGAAALLAAQLRATRDTVEALVARQWERFGGHPTIPPRAAPTIALALFTGLDVHRLVDPAEVTTETLDHVLAFFAAAARGMGVGTDPQ